MRYQGTSAAGFSLAELVLALLLTLIAASLTLPLVRLSWGATRQLPAALDLAQGVRGAVVSLSGWLEQAGAGGRQAPPAGPFWRHVPPLLPRRWGTPAPSPETTALATMVAVVAMDEAGTAVPLTTPVWPGDRLVTFERLPSCGTSTTCGLTAGATALILDAAGRSEFVRVASSASGVVALVDGVSQSFRPDVQAAIMSVAVRVLYWRAADRELRLVTDGGADLAVLDHVTDFAVTWFGMRVPPRGPDVPPGLDGCLHTADGAPRLAPLGGGDSLVQLPLETLADGPWCGEGATVFDADLLRVRRLRVRVRVETPDDALRGRGVGFTRPGRATGPHRVRDLEIAFDVAPPALN